MAVGSAFTIWILALMRTLALTGYVAWAMGPLAVLIALSVALSLAILYVRWVGERGALVGDQIRSLIPLYAPAWLLLVRSPQPWRGPVLLLGGLSISALLMLSAKRSQVHRLRWVGGVLAVVLPFSLYLLDISPYVGRADTFEFQVVAPTLGVAHPSGYPLYTLIGKLFSMIPVGTIAWRVNLSSAFFAALASGVLFMALADFVPSDGTESPIFMLGRLGVSWTLAFSPTLWSRSIEAEVYALNACLVALALWLAVTWRRGRWSTSRALPAFGLLIGLALASHVTLGALGLLALVMLLTSDSRPRVRTLLVAGALGLAGVAFYLYIPLRWPAVTGGERMSLGHFWRFVTNAESGGALHPTAFIDDPARWELVGLLLKRQVGVPGLVLAGAGLIVLGFSTWNLALGTLLMVAAWVWFNLSFYVADPDYSAFLIPAHVVVIFWLGVGVHRLLRRLLRWAPSLAVIGLVGIAVIPMWQLWTTGPTLDMRAQGYADEAWARYALQQPLVEGSAILADSEKFPPLYYLQQVEGIRPDLDLVTLFNEAQYRAALDERLAKGQAVYLARYLPGLDAYGVEAVGPLVRVAPDLSAESLRKSVSARWNGALALLSNRVELDPFGRRMHHLHLTWRAEADIDRDLVVKVRLIDPERASVLWVSEGRRPVGGYTSTQAWKRGTVVSDYVPLAWPAWVPPGSYRIELGVFQRFGSGLPRQRESDPWFDLGIFDMTPPTGGGPSPSGPISPSSLPRACYAGEIWLSRVDLPGQIPVGGEATLDVTWTCEDTELSGEPWLRWIPLEGEEPPPDIQRLDPLGYETPSAFCTADGTGSRPVRYAVAVPAHPGSYRVEIGWGTGRTARCRWLGRRREACPVARVDVLPGGEGIATYDNKILLVDAEVDAEGVPAGGPLFVKLQWRALQAMTEDYTVFVQVIGPDGQLYGQVDSWPVQGARPTGGWVVGEELWDPYQVYVDADAPSGEYRVIVGWYLLADMSRLPVIDAQGREVGDYIRVDTFALP